MRMAKIKMRIWKQTLCIWYLITFYQSVSALLDSKSEINTIHSTFIKKLGRFIRLIDIEVQKIDDIMLDTYKMVVAAFSIINKRNQIKFFENTFLLANVSPEVVLEMFFFIWVMQMLISWIGSSSRGLIPPRKLFRLPDTIS